MCLGMPGRVVETYDEHGVRMAVVDFGGATRAICLAYVPDAELDDHVIVHAGFAIARLDEAAAQESLALFAQLGELDAADDAGDPGSAQS